MDDVTIMAMLPQDEEIWYSMLIDHYTSYVTAIISGIGKGFLSAADIEEVAADAFYKLWLKREHLKTGGLKAYLAQITRNASIDRLRKKGEEFIPYDDDILQVTYHEQLDELAIVREQTKIIEAAVDLFKEPDREIFIRFYYFGESLKAISDKLQMNLDTAKTKLHRSRSKLREILIERGYGCE